VLTVRDLRKHFTVSRGSLGRNRSVLKAVDGVSFDLQRGTTLGIVGESGCGKSTLARTLLYLEEPTSGQITFDGQPVTPDHVGDLRRRMQIVFQDPYTSLPPRMTAGDIIGDALRIHGRASDVDVTEEAKRFMQEVGLDPSRAGHYPYQFSGGQRQRLGIARALAVEPEVIILDESVSALDVSVQAQILNLLKSLQLSRGLSYLFISHDLSVVRYLSAVIAVMYLGRIVETGPADAVYRQPLHPYTRALISAAPSLRKHRRERIRLLGEPPRPTNPPAGCAFHPRCPLAQQKCSLEAPVLLEWLPEHFAACHYAGEITSEQV
jgi:oligopeptide transport system ATP-binding protein